MSLSTDKKYKYLCICYASDGYYSKTEQYQAEEVEEFKAKCLTFQKKAYEDGIDVKYIHIFECSFKDEMEFNLTFKSSN
jgi:hypothetical protein